MRVVAVPAEPSAASAPSTPHARSELPTRSPRSGSPFAHAVAALFALSCATHEPSSRDDDAETDAAVDDTEVNVDTEPKRWRSALYPTDWTPAFTDEDGRFLHDFSYAGYHAGEAELPTTLPEPTRSALEFGADPSGAADSTAAIQATIDALTEGGTVLLPAGRYVVDGALVVRRSGVVFAGEGADRSFVHFRRSAGQSGGAGLLFRGAPPTAGAWPLVADHASRANAAQLASADGLAVGDLVTVGWTITEDFVADHGMTGTWTVALGQHRPFFRRTITAIDGDLVTLDVPSRYRAQVRDQAELRRDDGYLTEVGLQDLAMSTRVDPTAAWAAHRHHAVEMNRVMDGWIRRVATFDPEGDGGAHVQSGGLYVVASRRVTIAESTISSAQNIGSGGDGYLVEVSQVSDVLIRDVVATEGRHNLIQNWDFSTNGVVWLRTQSAGGSADNGPITVVGSSEFHHSLAMANLIDSSGTDDGWQCLNRRTESSGAGHAGTENVFWNVVGSGSLRSAQFGWGYVIGTGADLRVLTDLTSLELALLGGEGTAPSDFSEGLSEAATLDPPSLYEDQLARRTGR